MSQQTRKKVSWMLSKKYLFEEFFQAMQFANHVAMCAVELNHHPDILIKYKQVTISTCTHSEKNSITELDHKLAKEIDATWIKNNE